MPRAYIQREREIMGASWEASRIGRISQRAGLPAADRLLSPRAYAVYRPNARRQIRGTGSYSLSQAEADIEISSHRFEGQGPKSLVRRTTYRQRVGRKDSVPICINRRRSMP